MSKKVGLFLVGVPHFHFLDAGIAIIDELERYGIEVCDVSISSTGELLQECSGFIFVGVLNTFPALVGMIKRYARDEKKMLGIFEGSVHSCDPLIAAFKDMPQIQVIADPRPTELVYRVINA